MPTTEIKGILSGLLLCALGIAILAVGKIFPIENIFEKNVLEKIETQDPGYLRLPVRFLNRSVQEALTFDPSSGKPAKISFSLTKPAPVRIRIVRRDSPELVLRTLIDWRQLKLGQNEIEWDGRDASGNITANNMVHFLFQGKGKNHSRCNPDKCHDLKLEFASSNRQSPKIWNDSDITVEISEDRAYGPISGFSLIAYIDWQPWLRREFSKNTEHFTLPTPKNLVEGEHILAINIADKYDHAGSVILYFTVQPKDTIKTN